MSKKWGREGEAAHTLYDVVFNNKQTCKEYALTKVDLIAGLNRALGIPGSPFTYIWSLVLWMVNLTQEVGPPPVWR